jgi:tripartite-type tricarboxylate transporter receptor subunit TctC
LRSFAHAQFMEKLKQDTGADIVRVPFRGGNELLNAVLAGSTPVAILGLSNMIAQLRSGHVTGLAIASTARSPLFPDISTLAEVRGQDYPATWFGLFAPGGTPRPILQRLADEVKRIVERPDFRQRMFFDRGVEPGSLRLDDFAGFLPAARKGAEQLVKESGQRPQ